MAEKVGVENLQKCLALAIECTNVLSEVINKQGIWKVFKLTDELSAMSGLEPDALVKEVADLSLEERNSLKVYIKEKLVLVNPELEKKIEDGLDVVDEGVSLLLQAVALVKKALGK